MNNAAVTHAECFTLRFRFYLFIFLILGGIQNMDSDKSDKENGTGQDMFVLAVLTKAQGSWSSAEKFIWKKMQ